MLIPGMNSMDSESPWIMVESTEERSQYLPLSSYLHSYKIFRTLKEMAKN